MSEKRRQYQALWRATQKARKQAEKHEEYIGRLMGAGYTKEQAEMAYKEILEADKEM